MPIDHKALMRQAQLSARAIDQWSEAKRSTISPGLKLNSETQGKNQCEHGQLARVCNVCELQAHVKELEAQRDELLTLATRARVMLNMADMEYAFTDSEIEDLRADLIAVTKQIEAEKAG